MTLQDWISVTGFLVVLAVALLGFFETRRRIIEVHLLVNNQLDRQLSRNDQLTRTLTAAGVDVPEKHDPPPGSVQSP